MGFKDFERRVKDVKVKLEEEHNQAVEQSKTPLAENEDTVVDS
ncbi:MAG: hypothetical protein ACOY30_02780 [Bacillota bacterium]